MSPALAEASPERLSDQAYTAIKRAIINCALPPDAEVSEAQLALRFGFGKAPIRQALSRLSQERLVSAQPRRGYRVAPVTLRDVRELFELRLLVEPKTARLAAGRVERSELQRLDAVCQAAVYSPGDRDSAERFLAANREFHLAIARAAGNQRMTALLTQLLEECERLLHIGLALRNRSEEIRDEHELLIDALGRGDADAAERIAAEQVEDSHRMVREAILSSDRVTDLAIRVEPV